MLKNRSDERGGMLRFQMSVKNVEATKMLPLCRCYFVVWGYQVKIACRELTAVVGHFCREGSERLRLGGAPCMQATCI